MPKNKPYCKIEAPYLLLTLIPFYIDKDENIWLDRLWLRDFVGHTKYIEYLSLIAPCHHYSDEIPDLELFSHTNKTQVRFVPLKPQTSFLKAVASLPHTVKTLWHEVAKAELIHSGIAGWPFPLGWIANPIAMFKRKKLVLVVESAPWRIEKSGLANKIRSCLTEMLGRYFVRRADLTIATQPYYLESFGSTTGRGIGFVNPASWIDEEDIPEFKAVEEGWEKKKTENKAKYLFAGRFDKAKGVEVLLSAINTLEEDKVDVQIDLIGFGDLKNKCEQIAGQSRNHVDYNLLDPVPYGEPFFSLIQDYHCVLIPSTSDEQPRIIFDAYSQGVPVLASDTDGLRPHITNDTGWRLIPGSSNALVDAIKEISKDMEELARRGIGALEFAENSTHREMHRKRSCVLADLLK